MVHAMEMTNVSPEFSQDSDPEWWRGAVIYQIYPRSFQDHNGDGIGDLVGITQRLEYVADLGVDAIWLSPFFTSPMRDFGYDVSNYRDVDPVFGTIEDFDHLMEKAHGLGLRVIIDQVISHSSDHHAWFQESRQSRTNARADWYVWSDPKPDGTPPNNWLSIFGGSAWSWDSRRMQYYMHNFLSTQPDLNFHNPKVQDAVLDEMRFWLERGVDGFRLDTVNFYFCSKDLESNPAIKPEEFNASTAPAVNPYNFQNHVYDKSQPENLVFVSKIRDLLDEYPGRTSVGEIGDAQRQLELMGQYTTGDDHLHMAYTFDYLGGDFTPEHFYHSMKTTLEQAPDGWTCVAFSNHDVTRHVSRWAKHGFEQQFARVAAMLMLTMRGSVCLYQGEELALTEAEIAYDDLVDPYGIEFWPSFKGRDGCRTPMVWQSSAHLGAFSSATRAWLPVPADHLPHAVDEQEKRNDSTLVFYRSFLNFRKEHLALQKGSLELLPENKAVLAFTRKYAEEEMICVFNMSAKNAKFELPEGARYGDTGAPGSLVTPRNGKLNLPPFGAYIGYVEKDSEGE